MGFDGTFAGEFSMLETMPWCYLSWLVTSRRKAK
jgi:hypothetical protein